MGRKRDRAEAKRFHRLDFIEALKEHGTGKNAGVAELEGWLHDARYRQSSRPGVTQEGLPREWDIPVTAVDIAYAEFSWFWLVGRKPVSSSIQRISYT